MTLKCWSAWRTLVSSCLAIIRVANAGIVSYDADTRDPHHYSRHEPQPDELHGVSVASSFMHFHGPVEGPEFEVKVPYVIYHRDSRHDNLLHGSGDGDEHSLETKEHDFKHGYALDYVAHPKYQFSYGVEDHHTGDFHSQKETRDGSTVSGEYSVKEPGGNVRVVTYRADKDGFHAVVHTTGKNDHSGATYNPDAHQQRQGHHHPHQELLVQSEGHQEENPSEEGGQEYAAGYGTQEEYN